MAEHNCPMCGNPNPEGMEICQHCGARLTPLDLSKEGTSEDQSADWLDQMRAEASAGETGEEPAEPEELESGELESGELEPAELEPESLGFDVGAAIGLEPESDKADEADVPEWLRRIRDKQAEEGEADPSADFDLRAAFEEPDPGKETASADDAGEFTELAPDEEPDAFSELAQEPESPGPELESGSDLEPASTEPGVTDTQPESSDLTLEPTSEPEQPEPTDSEQAAGELPSWMQEVGAGEAEEEGPLPHVQALIGEQAEAPVSEDLGLPDWLGEIEPIEQASEPESDSGPDLAPATLPNWLEAMRPVDTFRSVVQIDAEEDQAIESVGPLAGLRGVLNAEPVVAMPRTSTVGSMQLEVSERQYAQAELLHKLLEEEEREVPAAPRRRVRLALFRWGIAALTVLAVALPVVIGSPSFPLPVQEPQELGPLFDLVQELPADQPALFVFDFDPGYAGELDAVSGPLIDQVMARQIPVASMSTRPTGSPMAERAISEYAVRHGYTAGNDLVHLGYLSGGPTAVQLFSIDPHRPILGGFGLPEEFQEAGTWETPVLQGVELLSDFSMVAVITAGSETARVWIEQAKPHMPDTPLLMVVSAGVEPLVRPYFEAADPQVDGILTGLPAATAYEQRNGRLGPAQSRWNAFGAGMLAAEFVLIAGVGYGIIQWWLGRKAL